MSPSIDSAALAGTPKDLLVRPMTLSDVPAVAALEKACFSAPWSAAGLSAETHNPHARFLTAELCGTLVGYIGCHIVCGEGSITNIAVAPQSRRRGVATALLKQLILQAQGEGAEVLFLEVRASNTAAQALYQRQGFAPYGVRRNFYSAPREDALLFKRTLP